MPKTLRKKPAVTKIEFRKNKAKKGRTSFRRSQDKKQGLLGPKNPQKPRTPISELVAKNSPARKPKTDRTPKKRKKRGKVSRKNREKKNGQHFPLIHTKKKPDITRGIGVTGCFGEFVDSSRNSIFHTWSTYSSRRVAFTISSSPRQALATTARTKKKTWGGEKQKGACEKGPVWGHKKRPHPRRKGPGRSASVGPWPHWQQYMPTKSPKKGASRAPAQDWAFPWESLLRGVGKTTRRVSETTPGLLDKVWPQNEQGKRKTRQKKHKKPLPPRVPRKGPREGASEQAQTPLVQGESQNRAGPRMAPREKRREAGRTAKTGETDKSGGKQKGKETSKNKCVRRGVLLLPELCLSKRKKQKRRRRKNLRKRERTQKKQT